MKRLVIATLVCLFVLGVSTQAKAIVLDPGAFNIAPTGINPVPAGTFVTSITAPVVYDAIIASVTQDVYLNTTGYLFVYQFNNTNQQGSINGIGRMTATNYTSFWTDVDAYAKDANGNVMPWIMPAKLSRSNAGDSIGFDFYDVGGVNPGKTSAILWIQTDAKYYGPGVANFINGGIEAVTLYGPTVPEPMTASLIGFGLLGFCGIARKRFIA